MLAAVVDGRKDTYPSDQAIRRPAVARRADPSPRLREVNRELLAFLAQQSPVGTAAS
jgi:hypothetical protein